MPRRSKERRWIDFMTFLGWEDVNDWHIVNPELCQTNIPLVKEWVRANIKFIQSKEATTAFNWYFFSDQKGNTSNAYYWKDRAQEALAAMYAKERASDS